MADFYETWDAMVNIEIATEDEIALVVAINGRTLETLNNIIYARTGHRDLPQYIDSEIDGNEYIDYPHTYEAV